VSDVVDGLPGGLDDAGNGDADERKAARSRLPTDWSAIAGSDSASGLDAQVHAHTHPGGSLLAHPASSSHGTASGRPPLPPLRTIASDASLSSLQSGALDEVLLAGGRAGGSVSNSVASADLATPAASSVAGGSVAAGMFGIEGETSPAHD
jgi:hypothetical protein